MRSGDEPNNARSPLGLRLGLSGFGLVTAVIGAVVIRPVAPTVVVLLFVAVALIAGIDAIVVLRELRAGAHFQPGPDVPPYRPVAPNRVPGRPVPPPSERTRIRRYLAIMITCLVLIVLAWFWVRFYSTAAAVAMSMVAAVLPPIAVIIANFGVRLPPDVRPPPDPRLPPQARPPQQRPLGWLPPKPPKPPQPPQPSEPSEPPEP